MNAVHSTVERQSSFQWLTPSSNISKGFFCIMISLSFLNLFQLHFHALTIFLSFLLIQTTFFYYHVSIFLPNLTNIYKLFYTLFEKSFCNSDAFFYNLAHPSKWSRIPHLPLVYRLGDEVPVLQYIVDISWKIQKQIILVIARDSNEWVEKAQDVSWFFANSSHIIFRCPGV